MQKALEQMNIQLHKVISAITGVTGLRILDAILAGERDRLKLAALEDYRIESSLQTIAKALDGDYRQEPLFALGQALERYRFYRQKISECDRQIEPYLCQLAPKVDPEQTPPPPPRRANKTPQGNPLAFDLRTHLYRISGVDFTQIEGFNTLTIQTILSEVGLDASRFATCRRFVSWLCLCPGNRITGGKVKDSRTRKTKNRAADAFRLAAQAAGNSTGPLGSFYRRLKSRLGAPKPSPPPPINSPVSSTASGKIRSASIPDGWLFTNSKILSKPSAICAKKPHHQALNSSHNPLPHRKFLRSQTSSGQRAHPLTNSTNQRIKINAPLGYLYGRPERLLSRKRHIIPIEHQENIRGPQTHTLVAIDKSVILRQFHPIGHRHSRQRWISVRSTDGLSGS
jgi:hypothetical protein